MNLRKKNTRKAFLVLNSAKGLEEETELFNIYNEEHTRSEREGKRERIKEIIGHENEIFGTENSTRLVDPLTQFHRKIMRKFISECSSEVNIYFVATQEEIIGSFLRNVLIKILRNLNLEVRKLGGHKALFALDYQMGRQKRVRVSNDVLVEDVRHLCGDLARYPLRISVCDSQGSPEQSFNFWFFRCSCTNGKEFDVENIVMNSLGDVNLIIGLTCSTYSQQSEVKEVKRIIEDVYRQADFEKNNEEKYDNFYGRNEYSESLSTIKTNNFASPNFDYNSSKSQNSRKMNPLRTFLQEHRSSTIQTAPFKTFKNFISDGGMAEKRKNTKITEESEERMSRYPSTGFLQQQNKPKKKDNNDISQINSKIDKMMSLILSKSNMNSAKNKKYRTPIAQSDEEADLDVEMNKENIMSTNHSKIESRIVRNYRRRSENSTQSNTSYDENRFNEFSTFKPHKKKRSGNKQRRKTKAQKEFCSKLMQTNLQYKSEFRKMKSELNDLYRIFKAQKIDKVKKRERGRLNKSDWGSSIGKNIKNLTHNDKTLSKWKKRGSSSKKPRKKRQRVLGSSHVEINRGDLVFKTNPKIIARKKPSTSSTKKKSKHGRNLSLGANQMKQQGNFYLKQFNKFDKKLDKIQREVKQNSQKSSLLVYSLPQKISIENKIDNARYQPPSYPNFSHQTKRKKSIGGCSFFNRTRKEKDYQKKYLKLREKIRTFSTLVESDLNLLRHRVKSIDSKCLINEIATRCRALEEESD